MDEVTQSQQKSVESKAAASAEGQEADFLNVNRRHQKDFNKHKSSQAMKTLLKVDEALTKRKQMIATGSQITSKMQFESRRNRGDSLTLETHGILNHPGSRT